MKIGIAGPVSPRALAPFLDAQTDSIPGGLGGTSVTGLVQTLVQTGHRVSAYSLSREVEEPVVLRGDRLDVYLGPYRLRHRMRDAMRRERTAIEQFVRTDRPDVVHAHWTYEFALGALAAGRPTLVTVRDWAPTILRLSPDLYRLGRLFMNVAVLRRAPALTAVSGHIADHLRKWGRSVRAVVPNGLPDNAFGRGVRSLSPAPVLLSVNNGFSRLKNVHALLAAFERVRRVFPVATLRLVGRDYEAGGTAARWAEARGLSEGVVFVGPMPHAEIGAACEAADLLVHPSLEESFGMTLIEAMARATPVIGGAKSGAVPWVLGEGRGGALVDVTDPNEIARAALELLANEGEWHRIGQAGHKHAWQHFRLFSVADQYVEVYRALLDQTTVVAR